MRDLGRGLQAFWRDASARSLLALTMTLVAIATLFYRRVEELSWLDSFYVSVITVSTVGYGDISPQTPAGKLFTLAYVVIGIGVFVALVTTVAHHLLAVKGLDADA